MGDSAPQAGAPFRGSARFRIERALGEGGMGTVYLAYDLQRRTTVALKTLRHLDGSSVYRFKREFRALADVNHPNLVLLHELLSVDGQWFFTMEYVEGRHFCHHVWNIDSLDRTRGRIVGIEASVDSGTAATITGARLYTPATIGSSLPPRAPAPPQRPPPLAPERFARVRPCLRQLAEGVQALHETGHLHRDIKPSNIMVTPGGRVVLLDFGIVADLTASAVHEQGMLIGTPAYMSPEQAAGDRPTPASDWYAVGLVLYEAITGTRAFAGMVDDGLRARRREAPPPPCEVAEDVPPDLNDLCCALLRCDPAARPFGEQVVAQLGGDTKSVRPGGGADEETPAAGKVVGRERELAQLSRAFDAARLGQCAVAFVSGQSGMGKTTLVRAFLKQAATDRRAVILAGRCHERESVPYKGVDSLVDALSAYLVDLDPGEVEKILPHDAIALARVFPVFRRLESLAIERSQSAITPDRQELRTRGFIALRDLVGRLAERRAVVLFVDDLQWSDEDSSRFLLELLRSPAPALLFLGCYRRIANEAAPGLELLLAGIDERAVTLEIGPLDHASASILARRLLKNADADVDAEVAEVIARESAGDPYFIRAVVENLTAGGGESLAAEAPLSLQTVLLPRIRELADPARRVLEILVVGGRPLSRAVALRAAEVTENGDAAVTALRKAKLIRGRGVRDDDAIEVYHSRIAWVVEQHMAPERVRDRHLALARALQAKEDPDAESLALHYRAAGEWKDAVAFAVRAADRAHEALAFDRAAQLYEMAIEMIGEDSDDERGTLLVRRADALANAGRSVEAARCYGRAADLASPDVAVELRRCVADHFLRGGEVGEGLTALEEVVRATHGRMPPRRGALLYLAGLRARVWLSRGRCRIRDPKDIDANARERLAVSRTGAVGFSMVDLLRGSAFQAQTHLLALKVGDPHTLARTLCAEAGFVSFPGPRSLARTEPLLERARRLGVQYEDPAVVPWADGCQALAEYFSGKFRRALALSESAERGFTALYAGATWERSTANLITLWCLFYLGRLREMAVRSTALERDAHARGDRFATAVLAIGNPASYWLARDDLAGASAARERAMRWPSSFGYHQQHWWDLTSRVRFDCYRGEPQQGWAALDREWAQCRGAQLHRSDVVQTEYNHLCASAALLSAGQAAEGSAERRRWMRRAERRAARLARRHIEIAAPMNQLVIAGLALLRGDMEEAIIRYDRAARGFDACDAAIYAACARRQHSAVLCAMGDRERGQAIMKSVDEIFAREDVRAPGRFAAVLTGVVG